MKANKKWTKNSILALMVASVTPPLMAQNEYRVSIPVTGILINANSTGIPTFIVPEELPEELQEEEIPEPIMPELNIISYNSSGTSSDIDEVRRILLDGNNTESVQFYGSSNSKIVFEIDEPSKLTFTTKLASGNYYLKLGLVDGTPIINVDGTMVARKESLAYVPSAAIQDVIFDELPAGQYYIINYSTSSSYNFEASEINVEIPTRLANKEKRPIIVTDFNMQSNNEIFGSGIALTDGYTAQSTAFETAYMIGTSDFINFTLNEDSSIQFYNTYANSSYTEDLYLERQDGQPILDPNGNIAAQSKIYISSSTTGWANIPFRIAAGEYKIRGRSSNHRTKISEISMRAQSPDEIAMENHTHPDTENDVIITNYSAGQDNPDYGRYGTLTDGQISNLNPYDFGIQYGTKDNVEFTINEDSVISFYDYIFSSSGIDEVIYLERQDGQAITDSEGNVIKENYVYIQATGRGWFDSVITIPAGDYRLRPRTKTTDGRMDIREIRALKAQDASYDYVHPDTENDIIITNYSAGQDNPDYGRYGALTDGQISKLDPYDFGIQYGTKDNVEFTINEDSVISFYDYIPSSSGIDEVIYLERQDGQAITDSEGNVIKESYVYIQATGRGWFDSVITIPAGDYRLRPRTKTTNGRMDIREIRALKAQDASYDYVHPDTENDVIITNYSAGQDNPDYGRYGALTDGQISKLNPYDFGIQYGTKDNVEFTINEDSVISFYDYIPSSSGIDEVIYLERQDGQAIIDSEGQIVKKSAIHISATNRGWFNSSYTLPAGDYRLRPRTKTTNGRMDIREIRALKPTSSPYQIPTNQNAVNITDFSIQQGNDLYGSAYSFVDGLTSDAHTYDTGMLYGSSSDYIDIVIDKASRIDIYFYYANSSSNQSVSLISAADGSRTDIETSAIGWASSPVLPAGAYKIVPINSASSTYTRISEIRAFDN
jgi:hypothetical protein